jgi:predicted membrane protein
MAALALVMPVAIQAQEYKLAKTTGTLEIVEVNDVTIEGTSGSEIIFSSRSNDRDQDERAQGLKAVSNLGLEDNTGLGLSVIDKGSTVEVRQLKKMDGPDIMIKVPKGIVISYRHSSPYGDGLRLKNLENEIKISTVHNEVSLENITGPMNVKTVHGEIDVSLSENPKTPIRIESVHGHVDVSIPVTLKANLKVNTSWGEIFIDPQLKIEIEQKGEMIEYSNDFRGKMNGGGMDVELSSTHENVYIRKK